MKKLTKEQKRDIRTIAAKRDEDIDFSDAPAVVDWSRAERAMTHLTEGTRTVSGKRRSRRLSKGK